MLVPRVVDWDVLGEILSFFLLLEIEYGRWLRDLEVCSPMEKLELH